MPTTAMQAITPLLEAQPPGLQTSSWRFRGQPGTLIPAAFFLLLAALFFFLSLPGWMAALCLLATVASALRAALQGLQMCDLEIDMVDRSYTLVRGYRLFPRKQAGLLADFDQVIAAPTAEGSAVVFLVPRGSQRGYPLAAHTTLSAAADSGTTLAKACGLPFALYQPHAPNDAAGDLTRVPVDTPVTMRPVEGGLRLSIGNPEHPSEVLDVTRAGLAIHARPRLALAGQATPHTDRIDVPWPAVSGVMLVPAGPGPGPLWVRVRPPAAWRSDMAHLWRQRQAESKRAARPLPWWGPLWYFASRIDSDGWNTASLLRLQLHDGRVVDLVDSHTLGVGGMLWLQWGLGRVWRNCTAPARTSARPS